MKPVVWAPNLFRRLNGVFCIYKPTGLGSSTILNHIKTSLCSDLNALPCYQHELDEARQHNMPLPFPPNTQERSVILPNEEEKDYFRGHRLVLGPRYINEDFKMNFLSRLSTHSSGVMMVGIGSSGMETLGLLSMAKFLRVYHVKGKLGYATMDSFHDGTFVQRTSYRHITKGKMDRICSTAQSGHQRLMFQYAGVDPNSEEAYRLASEGIIRPQSTNTPPILYSVKCIHFEPPDFTLEIHAINERCAYLANLIHDIGIKLKSTAVCTHIHRIRFGHFNLDHTLLKKDWHVKYVLKNMELIEPLLHPRKLFTSLRIGKRNIEDVIDEQGEMDSEKLIRSALKGNVDDKM